MKETSKSYSRPWIGLAFLCLAVLFIGIDDTVLSTVSSLLFPSVSPPEDNGVPLNRLCYACSTSQLASAICSTPLAFCTSRTIS